MKRDVKIFRRAIVRTEAAFFASSRNDWDSYIGSKRELWLIIIMRGTQDLRKICVEYK